MIYELVEWRGGWIVIRRNDGMVVFQSCLFKTKRGALRLLNSLNSAAA